MHFSAVFVDIIANLISALIWGVRLDPFYSWGNRLRGIKSFAQIMQLLEGGTNKLIVLMPKPTFYPLYHVRSSERNEDSPDSFKLVFWTCLKSLWDVNSFKPCDGLGNLNTWVHFSLFNLTETQTSGFPYRPPFWSVSVFFIQENRSASLMQGLALCPSHFCNEFSNICFAH